MLPHVSTRTVDINFVKNDLMLVETWLCYFGSDVYWNCTGSTPEAVNSYFMLWSGVVRLPVCSITYSTEMPTLVIQE